jgi:filamentous hemagglutinin
MNSHFYRIIFNKARGMLMVVAEIARSVQREPGRTLAARPQAASLLPLLHPLRLALWSALGVITLAAPGQAAIVADGNAPAGQQPTIINSANGTPQVNIQTPTRGGVSRNTFSRFDVDDKGVILNNSHAPTQTQLGGLVTGNPWLARGEARVILNEVNARDPSQLNGYIEVAGQKAQVVIANPAGITCNGCGFINANRATLTTGQAQLNDGQLTGYQVNGGEIAVTGNGLDSRGQEYTDIIARSVKVNAGVWAQNLKVTAGSNQVDAAHDRISATQPTGQRPQVAIDVAQLGGMYANKIRLIGTEQGVGVHNAGAIGAAAGELTLSASGRLENSGSLNGGDIALSAGAVENHGTLYAGRALAVQTSGALTNQGIMAAAGDVTVAAGTLENHTSGTLAAGMQADGNLTAAGNLTLNSNGSLTSHGTALAGDALVMAGSAVDLSGSQSYGKAVTLTARHGDISTAQARVEAATTFRADTQQTFRNDGGQLQAQALQLNAHQLSNRQGSLAQLGTDALTLRHQGGIDNEQGTIAANSHDLTLTTPMFNNQQGTLNHAGAGALTLDATQLNGTQGQMISNGAFALTGDRLVLDEALTGAQRIEVTAGSLSHQRGEMIGSEALSIKVDGLLDNQAGTLAANGPLALSGADIDNRQGRVLASESGSLNLHSSGTVNNQRGTLAAGQDLSLTAHHIDNRQGTLSAAGGSAQLTSHTRLNNDEGQISAAQALTLNSDGLNNQQGLINATTTALNLQQGALDNRNGILAAGGDLVVQSGELDNRAGMVQAGQDMWLDTHGQALINRENGEQGGLIALGEMTLLTGDLDNTLGLIGAQDLTLTSGNLNNQQGQIGAQGSLRLTAGSTDNRAGTLSAGEALALTVQDLNNAAGLILGGTDAALTTAVLDNRSGQIGALGVLTLDSGALQNDDGGLIQSGGTLTLDTHGHTLSNNHSGVTGGITSQGDLTLRTGTLENQQGAIITDGQLTLQSQEVHNREGLIAGLSGMAAVIGRVDNQQGAIQSGGSLTWAASEKIDNRDGLISAAGALTLTSDTLSNTSGDVISGSDLSLTAATLDNRDGLIAAQGNLTAHTQRFDNHAGAVQAVSDLMLDVLNDFTNQGALQANGDLTLTGRDITNAALIQAGETLTLNAANLTNQQPGDINAGATRITVQQALTNYGLIDGYFTHVEAAILNNLGTGRLYGDVLGIQAGTLNNLAQQGTAATLAARQRLDLGVGTLNNLDHALIYSDGDLALGGRLDENGAATGSAGALNNRSATIEAAGDMWLSVTDLNNINDHLETEWVEVSQQHIDEYQVSGTPTRYGPEEVSFKKNEVTYLYTPDYPHQNEGTNDTWYHYDYTRTVEETRITQSDPGNIIAGGNLAINSNRVLNDNSQIVAGRDLLINAVTLENREVAGQRHITDEGETHKYYREKKKGDHDTQGKSDKDYRLVTEQAITLTPGKIQDHAQGGGSGLTIDERATHSVTAPDASPLSGPAFQALGDGVQLPAGKTFEVPAAGQVNGEPSAAVVRMIGPDTNLPDNSLFRINPAAQAGYLVESDPRFTNQKQWLGSDHMLAALNSDPDNQLKRLGDGYYEQRLIREQVVAMTGQRYLGNYSSDEEQYRALMEAGIAFGQQYNLTPGIALTAEQMSQLTQDMVWLVAQSVTLPDGSRSEVLVPQVYARVQPGDLDGSGALLAGRNVGINLSGDLNNSGRIRAGGTAQLMAENITNHGGLLQGDTLALQARTDITNLGGTLTGNSALIATAGRDITAITGTRSAESADGALARTTLDRVAGFTVTGGDGTLVMQAGRDLTLTAAQVTNSAQTGSTLLQAGHDLVLNSVTTARRDDLTFDDDNWLHQSSSQAVGSELSTAGSLTLAAGHDLSAQAAALTAGGALSLLAGHDLTVTSGERRVQMDDHTKTTLDGLFSGESRETHTTLDSTRAQGSLLSGDSVTMQAGHDLTLRGSDVVGTRDVMLAAGNDLSLTTATGTESRSHRVQESKSGLMGSGGIGFTVGSKQETLTDSSNGRYEAGSTVGSLEGNVMLNAGGDVRVRGAELLAGGDLTLIGNNVTLESAYTHNHQEQHYEVSQSGLSLALSGSVGSAINSGVKAAQAANTEENDRLAALQAAKAGLSGYQAYQATQIEGGNSGDSSFVGIAASLGSQQSESHQTSDQRIAQGSDLLAGNNLTVIARDGDITAQGSTMQAGHDLTLTAAQNITLLAAENTQRMEGESSSSGGNIGVSIGAGSDGFGISIFADVNAARGNEGGNGTTWTESTATAGNRLALIAGQDVTLAGAQVSGREVSADIGGNLTLASLQDSDQYHSEQQNIAAGGSFTWGSMSGSGYISAGQQQMDADYQSVTDQTGIVAGSGGFNLNVGGHTQLDGAVIASTAAAALNQLDTGSLGWRDIANHAEFAVESQSIGISSGGSAGKQFAGNMANTMLNGNGNQGEADSTTHAAIAEGSLRVRDGSGTDIRRDTGGHEALAPIFDKEKEQAALDVQQGVADIGIQIGDIIRTEGKIAAQAAAKDPAKRAEAEAALIAQGKVPTEQAITEQAYHTAQQAYGTGSDAQKATQAITAAIQGALNGDIGSALGGAAAPYVAEYVKTHTDPGAERIISHALAGAILADLQNGSALAGAAGAGLSAAGAEYLTAQLYPGKTPAQLTEEEKQTVTALTTLAAGLAGSLAGGDMAAAVDGGKAGKNEVGNNYLSASQAHAFDDEMSACKSSGGNCQSVIDKYLKLNKQNSEQLNAVCSGDSLQCAAGMDKQLIDGGLSVADRPDWLYGSLDNEEVRNFVLYVNGEDMNYINANTNNWDKFGAFIGEPENLFGLMAGGKSLFGTSATAAAKMTGAGLSMGANAGVQIYNGNTGDKFDYLSFFTAGATGAGGTGRTLNPNLQLNVGGAYFISQVTGQNSEAAMIGAAAGTGIGYFGGSTITNQWESKLIKDYFGMGASTNALKYTDNAFGGSYIFKETKLSPIPGVIGGGTGSVFLEYFGSKTQNEVNKGISN